MNNIIIYGRIKPLNNKNHAKQEVYGINGISGCILSTVYKEPLKVLVYIE